MSKPDLCRMLHLPIARGGSYGVVGNGYPILLLWHTYARDGDIATDNWIEDMGLSVGTIQHELRRAVTFYECPTCDSRAVDGWL
jgi:hypothetical protein